MRSVTLCSGLLIVALGAVLWVAGIFLLLSAIAGFVFSNYRMGIVHGLESIPLLAVSGLLSLVGQKKVRRGRPRAWSR